MALLNGAPEAAASDSASVTAAWGDAIADARAYAWENARDYARADARAAAWYDALASDRLSL